jgi:hypothetical protein
VYRLPLFQLPLRPDTSSPSVCQSRVFDFATSAANAKPFVVTAIPLSFTFCVSIARFQLPLRIRFRLLIGTSPISVKFLDSSAFLRYSAFLRFLRRFLIVQAKQRLLLHQRGNCTVIQRDN